jgi:hypothetical protein
LEIQLVDGTDRSLVEIRDGPQLLEARECRLVYLPDGSEGAVWRGLAYPFYAKGAIDVTGPAFPPALCRSLESVRDPALFALIEGGEEVYLLLPGTSAECEKVASRMRGAGVTVLRTGCYLGDPVGGFQADWFVRFVTPGDKTDLNALLGRILDRAPVDARSGETEELRTRILRHELLITQAREAALREELRGTKARLSASLTARHPPTEISSDTESEEISANPDPVLPPQPAAFVPVTAPPAAMPSVSVPGRLRAEINGVFEVLLPQIELLRDSIDVIAAEFSNRRSAYRSLAELNASLSIPSSWKKVQGLDAWWERHLGNGQDDQGRAYLRHPRADRRWQVLISHKSEQERDLTWLRRQHR